MAHTIPVGEPTQVRAGDNWTWTKSFGDYPVSEGWALSYEIRGVDRLDWDSSYVTDDGNVFTIDIPSSVTAELTAGRYVWAAFVTLSGDRYTAVDGVFDVLSDLAQSAQGDEQTHAEKMVAAIEDEIEARITGAGHARSGYQINGRQLQLIPTEELTRLLGLYKSQVYRQKNPGTIGRMYATRFVRP